MVSLVAALAGAAIVGGLCLLVAGLTPTEVPVRPAGRTVGRLRRWRESRTGLKAAAAVGAALLVLLVTGWPVAAVATAATVWAMPLIVGTGRANAARIDRLTALEEWTRRLADSLSAQAGLEQALIDSSRTAPARIADPVNVLAGRLRAQWPTEAALRAFADDIDEATGDLVAAELILGARLVEVADLASIMQLTGEGGVAVYESLLAKSASLRDAISAREESAANAASERLSIPTSLLVLVFMIWLGYPAVARMLFG